MFCLRWEELTHKGQEERPAGPLGRSRDFVGQSAPICGHLVRTYLQTALVVPWGDWQDPMGQRLIPTDIFFSQLWGLEVEIQVPAWVGSGETLLGEAV